MEKELKIKGLKSVFLPAIHPEADRLLVVMHGLGDSADGFRFLPQALQFTNLHYLLLNAPDSYFTGYSWFDIYGEPAKGAIRSREVLFSGFRQLQESGFAPGKIGLLGFSQGAAMALDLACRYPETFGAVVGISGFLLFQEQYPEALSPVAKRQKILVTHGTEDPILPLEQTETQIQSLKGMGLSIDWRVYEKEHTIDPQREIPDIRNFLQKNLLR